MLEKCNELQNMVFDKLIQSNIKIYSISNAGESVLKTGRLLNFNIKLPFLYYSIEYKTKSRDFVLPQPFDYWFDEYLGIVLSYQLKDSCNEQKIVDRMKNMGSMCESKLFDKVIYISTINYR